MRRTLFMLLVPVVFSGVLAGSARAGGGVASPWKERIAPSVLEQVERGADSLDCLVVVRAPAGGAAVEAPAKVGLPGLATASANLTGVEQSFAARGLEVTQRYEHLPIVRVTVPVEILPSLAADERVVGVAPVRVAHALGVGGRALVGAPALADMGFDGRGVGVAVLDTGVDAAGWGDGAGRGSGETGVVRLRVAGEELPKGDGSGHGTSVAGIIAGPRWGVAPGARIIAVPVLNRRGEGDSAHILAGIDSVLGSIAAGNPYKIRVLVLALGGYDNADWPPGSGRCDAVSPDFAAAFAALEEAGVLVVAAAGNGGCATGVAWPACVSPALAVGAVYAGRVCSSSLAPQFGCRSYAMSHAPGRCIPHGCADETAADRISCSSDSGQALGLWAPGGCVRTLGRGGAYVDCFQGTSAAAAYVAGVAALLAQAEPGRTPEQLREALISSGPTVADGRNGTHKNRLDATAALAHLRQGCAPPATPDGLTVDPPQACGEQSVTLRWAPVKEASSYRLQVAPTVGFLAARELASAGASFVFRPDPTTPAVVFFRAAAVSACGLPSPWTRAVQVRYQAECDESQGVGGRPPSAPGAGGGGTAGPPPAPETRELAYLPGVTGNHHGADGATWSTEVTLANPGPLPARAQVTFMGDMPNASDTVSVTVPGAAERSYRNALQDLLGISRDAVGYLVVQSDRVLNVVGRTYARVVEDGKVRVFGESIPSFTRRDALDGTHTGTLSGLRSDDGYHTNLELVNVGDVVADVEVDLLGADGKTLATVPLPPLAPGERVQRTRVLPPGASAARGVVKVKPAGAAVIGYASVVDEATGNGATVPLKVSP